MAGVVVVSPVVVSDGYGNLINVDHAGKLKSTSTIVDNTDNPITTMPDADGYNRIAVDAKISTTGLLGDIVVSLSVPVPSDISRIKRDYVRNGGSSNLFVNGSVTPVEFTYLADSTKDVKIYDIRLLMVVEGVRFDGSTFGKKNTLTNGMKLEITSNGQTNELFNVFINEEFFGIPSPDSITIDNTTSTDLFVISSIIGGSIILRAGTGDNIKITVRDNLTDSQHKIFTCQIYGIKDI